MRAIMIAIALLAIAPTSASEISPIQLQLAAWCGAKATVAAESGGMREAYVACTPDRQSVHVVGPAAAPVAMRAQVDMRPQNVMRSKEFIVRLVREMLDEKQAPGAMRFIDKAFSELYPGESKEARFGRHAVKIERASDVMITMVVAEGVKAHHKAFEW